MGMYSFSEYLETFGGMPEPGETYPDDPDRLRDRLKEEDLERGPAGGRYSTARPQTTPTCTAAAPSQGHVTGDRPTTSPRERSALPPGAAGVRSRGEGFCGACGAPSGVPCASWCRAEQVS